MLQRKVGVVPSIDPSKEKIKFSFEYYDMSCNDFCLSTWPQTDVRSALMRLREICTKSFNALALTYEKQVYGFGEVYWEKTTKPHGFPDKRLNELPAFHFALVGINHQKARVFGAYQAGTFYIVWFDFDHKIWPSFKKHT